MIKRCDFKKLGVSTKTIMVYFNMTFDYVKIYHKLPITQVEVPLTKKKKKPDIKNIKAEQGSIISLRYENEYRGVKKHTQKKGAKTHFFLNQVTCVMHYNEKNIHIMIFKNQLKLAGVKDLKDTIKIVLMLWNHIKAIPGSYEILKEYGKKHPSFLFDEVMINVDYKLSDDPSFNIDRKKLNNLINDSRYKDIVYQSRFEPTGTPNVNIKMYCEKSNNFRYINMDLGDKRIFYKTVDNPYMKKGKKKKKYTTFLVFRSSKVIQSGGYYDVMEQRYYEFLDCIQNNVKTVTEKILDNNDSYVHLNE